MNREHWTDDELLEYVYGLRPSDEHFRSCPACAARLSGMDRVRAEATRAPDISDEFLAAQRRGIYQRLGSPLHPLRWAVPVIALLFVALGLTLYRAEHSANPAVHSHDDQFYAEISTFDQNPAPRAVQPIEALVQDDLHE